MKQLSIFFLLFLSPFYAFLQVNTDLDQVVLDVAKDYEETEELLLESIDWLEKTALSKNVAEREKKNRFVFRWMSGSPTVSISLMEGVIPTDSPECMMIFMTGWTKYSLNNNYSSHQIECAYAGMKSMIDFYIKNKEDLGRSKDMERFIKMQKKGTLKEHVAAVYGATTG